METKWIFKEAPKKEVLDRINESLGFGDLESRILALRNIDDYPKARTFFKPNISDIHPPFLMKDMQKAVDCILSVMNSNGKILIYGDYDVDGVSAVSLMYLYLSQIYDEERLGYYIPDRYTEGYGVSFKGIDFAKENDFSLIISLDCGIKSVKEVEYARSLGLHFIICDHHLPDDEIPNANAVLDPKQKDCPYPYRELSGCGVGFKFCEALNTHFKLPEEKLYELTDLLAISIAADIVPITGENRVLTKLGLKKLRNTQRVGLKLLVPRDKLAHFTTSNIVFEIAPKINAAGRIADGKTAVELLITKDEVKAQSIVKQIIDFNERRKELDNQITSEAVQQVEATLMEKSALVVYAPNWHKGVIGIVASRLVEAYYKPTLVFTEGSEGQLVASARSVADFDVHWAIGQCSDLLIKFGGHRAAAGLTMEKKNFQEFKNRFEEVVAKNIQDHQKTPVIEIDAVLKSSQLEYNFFNFHRKLAPFGPENMKPIFVLQNVEAIGVEQMGQQNDHIRFYISNGANRLNIKCVGFGFGKYLKEFKTQKMDVAFSIEENHWQGDISYILQLRDVKFKD
ncbi:MAG: single-stranded-DNA-specific exonuclease RecJ [Flavobacteriaceae bacterium]|nr:single-stranded-DNA-specific exonuclease RecJ [Flavobacteriaceae bacterium]